MNAKIRLLLPPSRFFAAVILFALLGLLFLLSRRVLKSEVFIQASESQNAWISHEFAGQLRPDQDRLESINQHVFSAHFDTRDALGGVKFVRLISVLDQAAYAGEFLCQFMHESGRLSYASLAQRSAIGWGMQHRRHYYKEFLLSCPVSNDTRSTAFVFVQTGDGTRRSQLLRVRHNPLSLGQKPPFPQTIVNCVSVTFGRPSHHRLIEWLEAQRLLKMDRVQLHFYHLRSRQFEATAQAYSAEGFVDVRRIGCPFCEAGYEETLGLLLMSPAINQCFYENLGRYKYTAVFDLDEIIVPQRHPDYPSLLEALEKQANTNSFAFPNWYHFFELGENASVPAEMQMLRHPYRVKQASPLGYSIKSIHKSCCVVALHNHYNLEDVPKSGKMSRRQYIGTDVGVLEHYKKCHFSRDECKKLTDTRDRRVGSRLRQLMGQELTAAVLSKARLILGATEQNK